MSIGRLDSTDRVRSRGSLAALLAAGLTAAVDLFYVLLIGAQSDTGGVDSRVVFVAGCLGAAAVCAAVGAVLDDGPVSVVLLAVAAFTLFIWTPLDTLRSASSCSCRRSWLCSLQDEPLRRFVAAAVLRSLGARRSLFWRSSHSA